jgi:hypothetical protein
LTVYVWLPNPDPPALSVTASQLSCTVVPLIGQPESTGVDGAVESPLTAGVETDRLPLAEE